MPRLLPDNKPLYSSKGIERLRLPGENPSPKLFDYYLARLDRDIETWTAPSVWDASNQRSLVYMKRKRTKYQKVAHRTETREQEIARERERQNGLAEMQRELTTQSELVDRWTPA